MENIHHLFKSLQQLNSCKFKSEIDSFNWGEVSDQVRGTLMEWGPTGVNFGLMDTNSEYARWVGITWMKVYNEWIRGKDAWVADYGGKRFNQLGLSETKVNSEYGVSEYGQDGFCPEIYEDLCIQTMHILYDEIQRIYGKS